MDRPEFESQHVPLFYLLLKCPEPLQGHPVFCSIGTGRFNRGQNGWRVMMTITFYLMFCKKARQKLTGRNNCKLAEQTALEKKKCK
jgi:hypothetical protein